MRIILADDEYVGVPREDWQRLQELLMDLNASYVQLVPRVGLSAGRNALVEACTTKRVKQLNKTPAQTSSSCGSLLARWNAPA